MDAMIGGSKIKECRRQYLSEAGGKGAADEGSDEGGGGRRHPASRRRLVWSGDRDEANESGYERVGWAS